MDLDKKKEQVSVLDMSKLIDKITERKVLKINNLDLKKLMELFLIPEWDCWEYENILTIYSDCLKEIKNVDFIDIEVKDERFVSIEFEYDDIPGEYNQEIFKEDLLFLLNEYKKNNKLELSDAVVSTLILKNKLNNKLVKKNNVKNPNLKL